MLQNEDVSGEKGKNAEMGSLLLLLSLLEPIFLYLGAFLNKILNFLLFHRLFWPKFSFCIALNLCWSLFLLFPVFLKHFYLSRCFKSVNNEEAHQKIKLLTFSIERKIPIQGNFKNKALKNLPKKSSNCRQIWKMIPNKQTKSKLLKINLHFRDKSKIALSKDKPKSDSHTKKVKK